MPKSRNRKDHKKKSRARTERINAGKRKQQLKFQEEFLKQMEELKNKELGIEEVKEK